MKAADHVLESCVYFFLPDISSIGEGSWFHQRRIRYLSSASRSIPRASRRSVYTLIARLIARLWVKLSNSRDIRAAPLNRIINDI
jgi:hypothetical protein